MMVHWNRPLSRTEAVTGTEVSLTEHPPLNRPKQHSGPTLCSRLRSGKVEDVIGYVLTRNRNRCTAEADRDVLTRNRNRCTTVPLRLIGTVSGNSNLNPEPKRDNSSDLGYSRILTTVVVSIPLCYFVLSQLSWGKLVPYAASHVWVCFLYLVKCFYHLLMRNSLFVITGSRAKMSKPRSFRLF
jgi:hypothetical protein